MKKAIIIAVLVIAAMVLASHADKASPAPARGDRITCSANGTCLIPPVHLTANVGTAVRIVR